MGLYAEYYGPADDKDMALVAERQAKRDTFTTPDEGDVVVFADGTRYRISHVWPDGVQTSAGGSWHWGASGHMSFSGGLFPSVPRDTLTDTGERETVNAWIFHHDLASAHRSVTVPASVKVWQSTAAAPR